MRNILLSLILTSAAAFAQTPNAPKVPPPADNGTALFRGLFHFYGVKPVAEIPSKGDRETILVILGPSNNIPGLANELVKTTLAEGGSVLVASDAGGNIFEGIEFIRMIPGPMTWNDPSQCLAGIPDYPLISGIVSLPGQPAFDQPMRIACQNPGSIRLSDSRRYLLNSVYSFPFSRFEPRPWQTKEVFALGGMGSKENPYRGLAMADQKVFSNQLMYASARDFRGVTPDNFRFANELVKWLTADGTRKECVFIENGKLQTKFDDFDFTALPPPKDFPFPPLPNPRDGEFQKQLANFIDQRIANLEDDPRVHQAFQRDSWFYGRLIGFLVLFGLSLAVLFYARRVLKARHNPDFQPLPADPHNLGAEAPLGSFEHRRLELLHGSDFRAPVAAYLRRLFESRGLPRGARTMPPLEIGGRNRGELKAMIRELWEEAFVFDRDPLPYTRWKEIEQSLATVKAAAEGNLWRFRSES